MAGFDDMLGSNESDTGFVWVALREIIGHPVFFFFLGQPVNSVRSQA